MKKILFWILFAAILVDKGLSVPTPTEPTDEEDDADWDEDDDSSEADDDGRVYKNPRNSPSTECPRDEEQATLLGQKCLRKCSSDEDCKSKKKKCLCDGACGMSCIKPDRECPELEKPALGAVTQSGKFFGARATYTCPHGSHVVGLQSRLCQADGQWAGTEPSCKQNIYCLTPPTIEHARHSALPEQTTFDLDSTVQYHCHTGYVTNGFPRAKCLAIDGKASWYGPDISCEPRSCGQPSDPAHGWHAGECYTFGCRITYHCGEGYELVGKQERFCQADGAWSPKELPSCVLVTAVQCAAPENPKNGKAIFTSCSYNSVVSYECKYGFTLVGESSRRCGADRKWSGQIPVCKEINCGHPGVLYNGWLENIESGTGLGASIIFRCHPGMLLSGHTSTVCQIDGRWRYPVPQCLAPCVVPTISQGVVSPIDTDVDMNATTTLAPTGLVSISKVKHGTILEVFCDEHYEFPISSLAPPTCNNGTWSVIPRCVPARCKTMPKSPKNGMVLAPKTEHGMKARFKCKDGFNLTGPGGKEITDYNDYVLTCSFGNWSGETPLCMEVYCQFPGYIPNGKVLLVGNMGLYDYRPYVKKVVNNKQIMYECDKGYVFGEGPPGATCVGGNWSPLELPDCIPGQHPRLRWNRKRRSAKLIPPERRYRRTNFLLQHYRYLDRWKREIGDGTSSIPQIENYRGHHSRSRARFANYYPLIRIKRQQVNEKLTTNLNDLIRKRRDLSEVERAYTKYYEKIREKYKNYVKNLLGQNRMIHQHHHNEANQNNRNNQKNNSVNGKNNRQHLEHDLWFENAYNSPELISSKYDERNHYNANRMMHKDQSQSPYTELMDQSVGIIPISIPNINEQISKFHSPSVYNHHFAANNPIANQKLVHNDYEFSNYFDKERKHDVNLSENQSTGLNNNQEQNITSIIEQLKSQLVRRKKRSAKNVEDSLSERRKERRNNRRLNQTLDIDDDGEAEMTDNNGRRAKPKTPCESIAQDSYIVIEVLRQGRDPNEPFSSGTIVKVTCGKGFGINLANPNATAKCVRGRWKPMKPACMMLPCTIPNTDNGHYFTIQMDSHMSNPKLESSSPLSRTENGQTIAFECNKGYNMQGPNQLRCWNGDWAVASLPECIPSPCILPAIPRASYQGGYRAGLTIAHGSSVTVQCDSNGNSNTHLVQMDCNLGSLSPLNINCGLTPIRKSREDYIETVDRTNLLNTDYSLNLVGRDCGPPAHVQGSLIYRSGELLSDHDHGFPTGTEILFNCISSSVGERSTWKIVCEDGYWVGRSFNCANGSCLFRNNEPHVVSFYNDLQIREEIVEFPPGATIISRCVDIGKYAMSGNGVRSCIHSEWSGQKPNCLGLNQENDYAMEKAPTILFRHQNGPIAQSNDGKLFVYPGTTVHMECLWMRRFGNPKWNVSHEYRKYNEGWVTEDGRDAQLEYRLSIFNAVENDSGTFTCQTPARHDHSVEVIVKSVNCPEIPARRGLTVSSTETKLSTKVNLSCINGNALIGASELICLPSGNWSAPLPVCESVECGDISLPPQNGSSPRVAILSREVGGRAAFSCPSGFGLRGLSESVCLPSGEWATPFPTCAEVTCDNPGAPQNGYAQGSPPYRAGDVVQFNCNPEYMMQGQPIIACQDNGRWSGGLPKCVQACSYPGTAISGRMSSVKFYYAIGESITFTCDSGLELRGAKMLKCLRNGKWSNAIPTCVHSSSSSSSSFSQHDSYLPLSSNANHHISNLVKENINGKSV